MKKKSITGNVPTLFLTLLVMTALLITGCKTNGPAETAAPSESPAAQTTTITILATSDLHGKLFPWDYIADKEDSSGSVFQLATAIKENYVKDSTLLVDAGDTVQDTFAEIFIADEIHPMMKALNEIGYDVWTTGNHEYDFGMENTEHLIHEFAGHAIVSNLYRADGTRVTEPYAIFEIQGVRIAVLCMVTPNIVKWNPQNLANYKVTNPIDETRLLLKELEGKYDVLLGVHHMGFEDENNVEGSGMDSYLQYFPEYDLVVASHEHQLVEEETVNGVLVVENSAKATSFVRVELVMEKDGDAWKVKKRIPEAVWTDIYDPDEAMMKEYEDAFQRIREYALHVIGEMQGEEPLVKEGELKGTDLPTAMLEPSALITYINTVMQYYAETDVSCAAMAAKTVNLEPGPVTVSDLAGLYPFSSRLTKVKMTGRQLKKLMEWSVSAYNTFQEGDLTMSFKPGTQAFNYEMFSGVNYEVDISKEPGSRIVNLTWPDGTPVKDEDSFLFAISDYRYGSCCEEYGVVFTEEDGLPELLDRDVYNDLGGVRGMLLEYFINVLHGELKPETENNWRIIGVHWDNDLHERAVQLVNEGVLKIDSGTRSVTEADVKNAEER